LQQHYFRYTGAYQYTLQQFQFPPKLTFYCIYRFYSLFIHTTIVTFHSAVHTPPHDHIRSVAALVACADNSRTATACSSGHFLAIALAAQQNRPFILLALQSQAHKNTLHLLRKQYEQCSRVVAWWPYGCCSMRSVRSGRASPGETEIDMERAGRSRLQLEQKSYKSYSHLVLVYTANTVIS
jgi:hypothetical protein